MTIWEQIKCHSMQIRKMKWLYSDRKKPASADIYQLSNNITPRPWAVWSGWRLKLCKQNLMTLRWGYPSLRSGFGRGRGASVGKIIIMKTRSLSPQRRDVPPFNHPSPRCKPSFFTTRARGGTIFINTTLPIFIPFMLAWQKLDAWGLNGKGLRQQTMEGRFDRGSASWTKPFSIKAWLGLRKLGNVWRTCGSN